MVCYVRFKQRSTLTPAQSRDRAFIRKHEEVLILMWMACCPHFFIVICGIRMPHKGLGRKKLLAI